MMIQSCVASRRGGASLATVRVNNAGDSCTSSVKSGLLWAACRVPKLALL